MLNPPDFESKLRELTQRQCQILYWVCQGLTFKEVAAKIGYGEDLVTAEMSRIYGAFGLTQQRRNVKRRILEDVVCPLHIQRVANPEMDCRERVIEVNAPAPDPNTVREVIEDAEKGLIPLKGALIPVDRSSEPQKERQSAGLARRGEYGFLAPPAPAKGNPLLWALVGVLLTLLALTMCVLVGVLIGGTERIAALFGPTPTAGIATVIVTQPAPTPAPSTVITVVVTQSAPLQTPPPVIQTVIVTQPPIPPTSPPTPQQANVSPCSAPNETVDMVGRVESDIPGTEICLGSSVTSVIDDNTRPRDTYAFDLTAGQEVLFQAESRGCVYIYVYNPNSRSIETDQVSRAISSGCRSEWQQNYTPAVSGRYYLSVSATDSGQRYTLSLKPTGQQVPINQVPSDIPGIALAIGDSRTSVLDDNTKPRDVYSIDLQAGRDVVFKAISNGCLYMQLYNPGSKSIETDDVSSALSSGCRSEWSESFTPAISGTYYFSLTATDTGQTYQFSVTPLP